PVLSTSAAAPTAVLKLPVARLSSVNHPIAVLPCPAVRLEMAFCPSAVLKPGYPPTGGGTTPKAFVADSTPDHASAIRIKFSRLIFVNGFKFLPFRPLVWIYRVAGPEEAKNPAGRSRPPDSDPLAGASLPKIPIICQLKNVGRRPTLRCAAGCASFVFHTA